MSLRDPNPVSSIRPKRVAVVTANPAISSTSGWPTGFWWSELTHPYLAFEEVGFEIGQWRSFAVRDGNLITGQQNVSGAETARLVIEALGR